jgi:Protein of unknown function (DUF4011)/REase_MTES_1575/AAA domain/HIRAN domain
MALDISGPDSIDVVGESFYREALQKVIAVAATDGASAGRRMAALVPDPANPYDRNAIKVVIDGEHVGHIPRELAALIAAPLAALAAQHGVVTATAQIAESGRGVVLDLNLLTLGVTTVDEDDIEDGSPPLDTPLASTQGGIAPSPEPAGSGADAPPGPGAPPPERREKIERAVERWKSDLIDLTARNRLLYFRDLQTGTLNLDSATRDVLMRLVAGSSVALSKLVPRSLTPSSPLAKLTPFEDAVRRTRAIARTARSYEEERGVRTLFLACGMATWKSDRASRPPSAPVLLVPIVIRAKGASQLDFELSTIGDLEVNPTLLHLLRVEHGLSLDEKELFDHAEMDGVIDTPEELRLTFNWLSQKCASVEGWAISERFVLANFWYAKLPMVRDLEASVDVLSSHDVAAALAGDGAARQAVLAQRDQAAITRGDVDELAPAKEFNVLDSDSSQSLAIARALSGENLVLRGPPGTGKSQTIANLICGAIGEGKRVLFVAEKRAAIDAVTKRLKLTGLEDLVLDLHHGAESRKWLAAQLGISLEAIGTAAVTDHGASQAQLSRTREALREHARELHRRHQPWGASLFTAQAQLLALGQPVASTRLRGADLEALTEERFAELLDALRDMLSLDGLSLSAKGSPWAAADVRTPEVVAAVSALLEALDPAVPELEAAFASAAQETGLPAPLSLVEAGGLIELWELARARVVTFTSALFQNDIGTLAENLQPLCGSAVQRLLANVTSSEYRSALALVRESLAEGISPEPKELHAELLAAAELQQRWEALGDPGQGPRAPEGLDALHGLLDSVREQTQALGEVVGRDLAADSLVELKGAVAMLRAEAPTLSSLPRLYRAREEFGAAGLASFLAELEAEQDLLSTAEVELDRLRWRSIVDQLMLSPDIAPALAAFRGERHDQAIAAFRELDRAHVRSSAQRVRRTAAEAAVRCQDTFPDEAQLVRAQAKRKRGHLPVRELFAQAPNVVTALRPCWVMSPLMVSQLIPSEQASFDIVVFDEASQVRPVDALTSMIRGKQLVVAGDEHQLPPTAFFDLAPAGDNADPESDGEESSEIGDYESLLDVLMTLFAAEMLRWHYRSQDERLIGFSNGEIYDGALTTFPGVVDGEVLRHVLVEDLPAEDEVRVSPDAEVQRVVELILEHASANPEESLGVIALGIRHAEAIDAGLLARLPAHPELEEFFSEENEERFFVKNLERVQGDERDAIILAVGYGREADGSLPHRFGPLNNAGGERRLNVAVTRAKKRMTVVSSFAAEEVDPARSKARGVQLLKAFLAYAATGGTTGEVFADGNATVLHGLIDDALAAGGFKTEIALGSSADRIDVAVLDPETARPAVAVEVDGNTYAARPSVRDRDRLRREQLERLGWKHVMTWSQDWYRDRSEAARRLIDQVAAKLDGADEEAVTEARDAEPLSGSRSQRPHFASGGPAITDWRLDDLVKLARWIESDGRLRTGEELEREMMREIGITRRGARVARALEEALSALRRSDSA